MPFELGSCDRQRIYEKIRAETTGRTFGRLQREGLYDRMRTTTAWVRLAPQNPNDLREGNPEVLLMV